MFPPKYRKSTIFGFLFLMCSSPVDGGRACRTDFFKKAYYFSAFLSSLHEVQRVSLRSLNLKFINMPYFNTELVFCQQFCIISYEDEQMLLFMLGCELRSKFNFGSLVYYVNGKPPLFCNIEGVTKI